MKQVSSTNSKSVYKIKLRTAGYRLAYEVLDDEISYTEVHSLSNNHRVMVIFSYC